MQSIQHPKINHWHFSVCHFYTISSIVGLKLKLSVCAELCSLRAPGQPDDQMGQWQRSQRLPGPLLLAAWVHSWDQNPRDEKCRALITRYTSLQAKLTHLNMHNPTQVNPGEFTAFADAGVLFISIVQQFYWAEAETCQRIVLLINRKINKRHHSRV